MHRALNIAIYVNENESGFRPFLCTYRLNRARRTSWGWWDETQDPKFEPWRSEAEHATSRSRRLPTILSFTSGWGRNIFVSFKPPRPWSEPRTLAWKAAVLTTTIGPRPAISVRDFFILIMDWRPLFYFDNVSKSQHLFLGNSNISQDRAQCRL